mmetsp:Transcript_18610/g.55627  ORF Transcript_18610/g.55627 Transcript_18610/m.55627 type:complete len:312 (-) Transcript_18610:65-1000(-)
MAHEGAAPFDSASKHRPRASKCSDGAKFLHVAHKVIEAAGTGVEPLQVIARALRPFSKFVPGQLHDLLRDGNKAGAGGRGALQHNPGVLPLVGRRRILATVVPRAVGRARLALLPKVIAGHMPHKLGTAHKVGRGGRRLAQEHERLLARVGSRRCARVPVVAAAVGPITVLVQRQFVDDGLGARDEGGACVARLPQDGARLLERVGRRRVVQSVVAGPLRRGLRVVQPRAVLVQLELAQVGGARDVRGALRRRESQHTHRLLVRLRNLAEAEALLSPHVIARRYVRRVAAVVDSHHQLALRKEAAVQRVDT